MEIYNIKIKNAQVDDLDHFCESRNRVFTVKKYDYEGLKKISQSIIL